MRPEDETNLRELLKRWSKLRDSETWAIISDLAEENAAEGAAFVAAGVEQIDREIRRQIFEELIGEQGNLERKPWRIRALTDEEPHWVRDRRRTGGRPGAYEYGEPNEELRALDGTPLWTDNGEAHNIGFWMDSAPEWLTGRDGDLDPDGTFNTVYIDDGDPYLLDVKTREIWKRVYSGVHTPEKECPYKDWDPHEGEDAQDRDVVLEDTLFGEHPGERCFYCDEAIGEKHGYIYDEGGEFVYQLLPNVDRVDITEESRGNWEALAYAGDDEVEVLWDRTGRGYRRNAVFHSEQEAREAVRRVVGVHVPIEVYPFDEDE